MEAKIVADQLIERIETVTWKRRVGNTGSMTLSVEVPILVQEMTIFTKYFWQCKQV